MTPHQQRQFVRELINTVEREIADKIASGAIPEEWDGVELRQYLADKFAGCIIKGIMRRARTRAYRNTVLINNL